MPRFHALIIALVFAAAVPAAFAGDFVPRAGNGFGAVGDDPGARSASDMGPAAAMSEPDSTVVRSPGPAQESAPPRHARVGADDVATTDSRTSPPSTAAADADEKPAAPAATHKARSLRWQSLLPGVMK